MASPQTSAVSGTLQRRRITESAELCWVGTNRKISGLSVAHSEFRTLAELAEMWRCWSGYICPVSNCLDYKFRNALKKLNGPNSIHNRVYFLHVITMYSYTDPSMCKVVLSEQKIVNRPTANFKTYFRHLCLTMWRPCEKTKAFVNVQIHPCLIWILWK